MTQTAIVQVNVSQTLAPAPSTLQRTGYIISQGGTKLAPQASLLLTQASDLTAQLASSLNLSALTWAGGTATATTSAAHGWNVGDVVQATITGVVPIGWNGTYNITITSTTQFTFPLTSNPGSVTTQGKVTLAAVAQVQAAVTNWFANGLNTSVYVLELGEGIASAGVTGLTTWLNNNPKTGYNFLIPYGWDAESTFLSLVNTYATNNSMTYFYTTVSLSTYASFAGVKSVVLCLPSPNAPTTEFMASAMMQNRTRLNPASTNQVTPTAFQYLLGVTVYPITPSLAATLKTANVNYVGTGAEGGISNKLWVNGVTGDGNDVMYWYGIDWVQINLDLNISNEIINGSNNSVAPLYYNQNGINRLQARAAQVLNQGISYGMILGSLSQVQLPAATFTAAINDGVYKGNVGLNAVPFANYVALNPNDYPQGLYTGLTAVYTAARGFINIVFNVNVSTFA